MVTPWYVRFAPSRDGRALEASPIGIGCQEIILFPRTGQNTKSTLNRQDTTFLTHFVSIAPYCREIGCDGEFHLCDVFKTKSVPLSKVISKDTESLIARAKGNVNCGTWVVICATGDVHLDLM